MKYFFGVLVFFFRLHPGALAEPPSLGDFRNKILSDELMFQIKPRLAALQRCRSPELSDLRGRVEASKQIGLPAYQRTLLLLETDRQLYLDEFRGEPCASALKSSRLNQERLGRKKFRLGVIAPRLLKELDPNCNLQYSADFSGVMDHNPCFAGAAVILKNVFPTGGPDFETFLAQDEHALNAFEKRIHDSSAGSALEMDGIFPLRAPQEVHLLTFIETYATSRNGYVGPYTTLINHLSWENGADALTAYKRYMRIKNLADQMSGILHSAQEKKISLFFAGSDVTRWNHHNWMAASLALHYRDLGKKFWSKQLPILLGTLYESKDAASHLRDGSSLRDSWKEFRADRRRYVDGVKLAHKL